MGSATKRRCCARHHLSELVTSGEKHKVKMPACSLVLSRLEQLENGDVRGSEGVIAESKRVLGSSQSVAEVLYWTTRILTACAFLVLIFFLFVQ